MWDYWHSLQIGAPRSYELATAVWTLSLNHWFLQGNVRLLSRPSCSDEAFAPLQS